MPDQLTADPFDATARVARGAARLDEVFPGWEANVDLAELDLSECDLCVLGQIYGEYGDTDTSAVVPVGDIDARAGYGFSGARGYSQRPDYGCAEFDALEAEWRRLITERRAKEVVGARY